MASTPRHCWRHLCATWSTTPTTTASTSPPPSAPAAPSTPPKSPRTPRTRSATRSASSTTTGAAPSSAGSTTRCDAQSSTAPVAVGTSKTRSGYAAQTIASQAAVEEHCRPRRRPEPRSRFQQAPGLNCTTGGSLKTALRHYLQAVHDLQLYHGVLIAPARVRNELSLTGNGEGCCPHRPCEVRNMMPATSTAMSGVPVLIAPARVRNAAHRTRPGSSRTTSSSPLRGSPP